MAGSIVRTVPETLTWASPTGITVSVPSVMFLMVMLPLPAAIVSSKFATRFVLTATPLASSAGFVGGTMVGAVPSAAVWKFHVVSSRIPAKAFGGAARS